MQHNIETQEVCQGRNLSPRRHIPFIGSETNRRPTLCFMPANLFKPLGIAVCLLSFATQTSGQVPQATASPTDSKQTLTAHKGQLPDAPHPKETKPRKKSCSPKDFVCQQKNDSTEEKQTNRMFWIVPNFTAVSAGALPPPETPKQKFSVAMHDSVDYTSFVWAGVLAAQSMGLKNYPELGQGAAGYGRYYWRSFADQASGAFFTEALVPVITHEDPRYFTLGHGGFFRRTAYAVSQLVMTRLDNRRVGFNMSEVGGNALVAAVANTYYPSQERGASKTAINWATQMESAGLNNIVKEFWPDIRRKVFRRK
jgi:hypothetical protein